MIVINHNVAAVVTPTTMSPRRRMAPADEADTSQHTQREPHEIIHHE